MRTGILRTGGKPFPNAAESQGTVGLRHWPFPNKLFYLQTFTIFRFAPAII